MADAEVVRSENAEPQAAQQFVAEMSAVASRASALAHDVLATTPLPPGDAARHLPIEIEVSGLDARVTVAGPARPGAVRGAVEKALRDLGLATIPG
jgi:hypothetical protein